MPNHVANLLKIKNIRSLPLLLNTDGKVRMDFNRFLPMPESLDIESGSMTDEAIVWYLTDRCTVPIDLLDAKKQAILKQTVKNFMYDYYPKAVFARVYDMSLRNPLYANEDLYEKGSIYVKNYEKYGAATWYDWCSEHWGTKWNAYSSGISDTDPDALFFLTAWCPPFPVIEAVSRTYPSVRIELSWADEEEGYRTGHAVYQNGACVSMTEYEDESAKALRQYKTCWGARPFDAE